MNELLAILATTASLATSSNCAAINNFTDSVAWTTYPAAIAGQAPKTATYKDKGTLVYSRRVPLVVKLAEATLRVGRPGIKVRIACNVQTVL